MHRPSAGPLQVGLILGAVVALAFPVPAAGQGRAMLDTLSAAAVAESLAVIQQLDRQIRANRGDFAALHRKGVVAFVLSERARRPNPPPGISHDGLWRTASSSLQQASRAAPDSSAYLLDLGFFYFAQRDDASRATARNYFEQAVLVARANGPADRRNLVAALLEVGRGRAMAALNASSSGWSVADSAFAEAYELAPEDPRPFHYLARSLASRGGWTELLAFATRHTERMPDAPWGYLTLGLARQRQRDTEGARRVFATALELIDTTEAQRLFSVERILRPSEAVEYASADSARRAVIERMAWLRDDPLWSTEDDDIRTEFYARVTLAELLWSVPERGLVGASTGPGNSLVRYGARPVTAGTARSTAPEFEPMPLGFVWELDVPDRLRDRNDDLFAGIRTQQGLPDGARIRPERGGVTPPNAPTSVGAAMAAIGGPPLLPRRTLADPVAVSDVERERNEANPSGWANAVLTRVDSLPVQLVRFRGGADSIDVYFASEARLSAIRNASATNARARGDFFLYGIDVPNAYRDSVELLGVGALRWVRRVPAGTYLYRVEASAEGSLRAGRATATINLSSTGVAGIPTQGFGLSDVLLASAVTPRGTPRRWRDYSLTPLLAPVDSGGVISLLWETYETAAGGELARYGVSIVLEPVDTAATAVARIAARVAQGVADALGVTRSESDRGITFEYEREVRHAPALVDHVALELGATPPGVYRVTLTVTDRVSGQSTTRLARIAVRR